MGTLKKKTSRTISKTKSRSGKHVESTKKYGVRVAHHKHTGRRIGISFTSYTVLYFILVLTGATLFFASNAAQADQTVSSGVNLTGRMKGPIPQFPATFIEPSNNGRVNTNTVTIRGTCQPGLYVELFRYSTFAGATLCGNSGEFQLTASLRPGQNNFIAKMSDADAQYAPDSSVLAIFYDIPKKLRVSGTTTQLTNPNDPAAQNQNNPPNYEPLIVTTALARKAYPINKVGVLKYTIIGGVTPYAVSISWDDGSLNDLFSLSNGGEQTASHKFAKSGQHVVSITVSDGLNNKTTVQTIVSVTRDYTGVAGAISPKCVPGSADYFSSECYVNSRVAQILDSVWPAFGVAVLMTTSFWFGERIVAARAASNLRHKH